MVGSKEDLAVLALALSDVTSHWPDSPQVNDLNFGACPEENGEETRGGRRQKKGRDINCSGRKRKGADLYFQPGVRLQFQDTAVMHILIFA
jgi:hypothetical protein